MNRIKIYAETFNYTKKNWPLMISYSISVIALGLLIGTLLGVPNYLSSINAIVNDGLGSESALNINTSLEVEPYQYILQILVSSLTSVLNAGLMFAVLQTYREKTRLSVAIIMNQITKKPFTIFLACLIISLINFIISIIPVVGSIISLIFVLASYFALIVLQEDDNLEPIDALKRSFILTKGHKLNLLIIEFKYFVPLLIALVVMLLFTVLLKEVGMGLGILLFIFIALRMGPNLIAAAVIYYDKLVNG